MVSFAKCLVHISTALAHRDGFRERGALGHLSFGGPKHMKPIWLFV